MMDAVPTPAYAIRTRPEDFVVVEEPLYAPSGRGTHLFVRVEKRGRTTEQVARDLARVAGVSARDVGYAGRKDRHALTTQWFSLPGDDPERALGFELADARVLEAHRHEHKLRTGQLRGNRFEIALRGEGGPDLRVVRERAAALVRRGLPNRYGEQRFGRDGDNAERARRLLEGERPPRDRRAARFLLSALQSEIFNAVLEARGDAYDDVEVGDLARVEASGGLFWVDDLARERPRAAAFEISATGPIVGTRMRSPRGPVAEAERAIFERWGLPDPGALALPRGLRLPGARRPLRVRPEALEITPLEGERGEGGGGLRIRCGLPRGSYVTVLLEALVGPVLDAAPRRSRENARSEARGPAPVEGDGPALSSTGID